MKTYQTGTDAPATIHSPEPPQSTSPHPGDDKPVKASQEPVNAPPEQVDLKRFRKFFKAGC